MRMCPRCGDEYDVYPALSRRDNKTEICPDCGQEEALIDAGIKEMNGHEILFRKMISKYPMIFINVYEKSHHYGGPEEGGWYYTWFNHIITYTATTMDDAKKIKADIEEEIKQHTFLYDEANCIFIERDYAESKSTQVPYYN